MRRIIHTSIDRAPLPMAAEYLNIITHPVGRQRGRLSVNRRASGIIRPEVRTTQKESIR